APRTLKKNENKMKKRICICLFVFILGLFHLSIPSVVFGQQSPAAEVFKDHKETILDKEIHPLLPDVLDAFSKDRVQSFLSPPLMLGILKTPGTLTTIDSNIDPLFLGLLTVNSGLRELFADEQFYNVLDDPIEINKLVELIENAEPVESTDRPDDSKPTSLSIVSGYGQEGEPGSPLSHPFVVEVRDQYGAAFSGANVNFRVTQGGGHLLPTTARPGYPGQFRATLTLGSSADVNVVRASVSGISPSPQVFFTASAIAPPPPEPKPEPKPVMPEPLSTPEPSQLPPVYWIEDNVIYYRPADSDNNNKELLLEIKGRWTLTGGLAVDTRNKRIYWTEGKSYTEGRILSANLDGGDRRRVVLETGEGVPLGVAINTKEDRVCWTTSSGKVQCIDVKQIFKGKPNTGSIKNLDTNQNSPKTHIAFDEADGLYWTEPDGIKKWRKKGLIVPVSTNVGGIAVANGRVYWTEQTDDQQGVVRWKAINGPGGRGKFLAELTESVPKGIAVDAEGDRVYWTTSLGGIQSAPVPKDIETVVADADIPATGIALGNGSLIPLSPAAPAISSVGPQESTLLANYPNPFNPETWIPYQLSESADVSVSIYSVNGSLIRTLVLGHQAAGIYQSKSRAAYWDGRNEFGERVASGLYFYTLTAGDFTATRKMLIRK
ncbi:T9SS type A sorting domain-containing protein, partial [Candidatus Poribacteria bacterium]|nr:T9SS type A sorting domain-containing protein [Candidatus Poribacteria bacterium]